MPKLSKQFYLEISVEQFLQACSPVELHEINMRLDVYLRKAERKEKEGQYRTGKKALFPEHTVGITLPSRKRKGSDEENE